MGIRLLTSSLTLVALCMWTPQLSAAELAVSRYANEINQGEMSALNLLGIRYARGQGVKRNPGMAMRFFLRSAMQGYTPAMANIGTLYEIGATGRPNLHRAFAWVRTALAFGVPEEDHDTTVLKLGMIAARLGADNVSGAEQLADALAARIVQSCECSPGQETELAFNRPL
jgi:TPR repeat protein